MDRHRGDVGRRRATPKKEPVWQKAFLLALAKTAIVSDAARVAKVSHSVPYALREVDPAFAAAWEQAKEQAADRMEKEALRRAVTGCLEPVFGSGGPGEGTKQVGSKRVYSDTLLIFLLKGIRPEKYRERFENKHAGSVEIRSLADLVAKVGDVG